MYSLKYQFKVNSIDIEQIIQVSGSIIESVNHLILVFPLLMNFLSQQNRNRPTTKGAQ